MVVKITYEKSSMKDPMNAMKDMNAGYMKSNVKCTCYEQDGRF